MLWMYLLILGLFIAVTVGVVFYGTFYTQFTVSDMKIVDDEKLSTLLCASVTLDTSNPTSDLSLFSAYLLDSPVQIDTSNRDKIGFDLTFNFDEAWSYPVRQFYFLTGSSLTASCQTDVEMDMILIKGLKNYTIFKNSQDHTCPSCDYAHVVFDEKHAGPKSWTFPDTDEYYFIFITHRPSWVQCTFDIERTVYNTELAISSCLKSTTCEFSLDIAQHNPVTEIVIKLEPESEASGSRYMYSSTSVQTSCVARLWIYLLLFLGCPGVLCIILSVLIYKGCSDPVRLEEEEEDTDDEQAPLLWDNVPQYSGTVVTEPPKYEDVVAEDNQLLPSYEEAVASGNVTSNRHARLAFNVTINNAEPLMDVTSIYQADTHDEVFTNNPETGGNDNEPLQPHGDRDITRTTHSVPNQHGHDLALPRSSLDVLPSEQSGIDSNQTHSDLGQTCSDLDFSETTDVSEARHIDLRSNSEEADDLNLRDSIDATDIQRNEDN